MLSETRGKLAKQLFDVDAIKFGAFRLKLHEKKPDAPLSPIYVDLRILRSFPEVMDSTIEVYEELTHALKFDVLADVPTAATPIVALLSHSMRIPMISPRLEEKAHGLSGKIDGVFHEGQVALLVDDLVTRAESKLEAISILQTSGLVVRDIAVLVDREQGGIEKLRKAGYTCWSVFKLSGLLSFYLDNGKIDRSLYDRVLTYLRETVT